MIGYIEDMMHSMQEKLQEKDEQNDEALKGMEENLAKLKPVIQAHDEAYASLQTRENEMERLLHEFKNSLMIEKIKMDTWENRKKGRA
jgi:hypothetical protein